MTASRCRRNPVDGKFPDPGKGVRDNVALHDEFNLIGCVEIVAPPAGAEVFAWRCNSVWGLFDDLKDIPEGVISFVGGDGHVDPFSGKHSGNKEGLPFNEGNASTSVDGFLRANVFKNHRDCVRRTPPRMMIGPRSAHPDGGASRDGTFVFADAASDADIFPHIGQFYLEPLALSIRRRSPPGGRWPLSEVGHISSQTRHSRPRDQGMQRSRAIWAVPIIVFSFSRASRRRSAPEGQTRVQRMQFSLAPAQPGDEPGREDSLQSRLQNRWMKAVSGADLHAGAAADAGFQQAFLGAVARRAHQVCVVCPVGGVNGEGRCDYGEAASPVSRSRRVRGKAAAPSGRRIISVGLLRGERIRKGEGDGAVAAGAEAVETFDAFGFAGAQCRLP